MVLQYSPSAGILGFFCSLIDFQQSLFLGTVSLYTAEVFNEVNAREMEKLNVFRHTFNNWIFVLVVLFTVVFQVILVEFLGKLANTTPLNLQLWGVSLLIGAVSVPIAVIGKFVPVPSKPFFELICPIDSEIENPYQQLPNGSENEV